MPIERFLLFVASATVDHGSGFSQKGWRVQIIALRADDLAPGDALQR
jgi:hypothetical protein